MLIRFQHTELVNAAPARLFGVITGYERYPEFNKFVRSVTVVHRDASGAEVVADRRTPIGRHVRFWDTYSAPPLLQLRRRYADQPTAGSVWTVEAASGGRSYYTIEAEMRVPFFPGLLLHPILKRMFWQLNFPPFIRAAIRADLEPAAGRPDHVAP